MKGDANASKGVAQRKINLTPRISGINKTQLTASVLAHTKSFATLLVLTSLKLSLLLHLSVVVMTIVIIT